VRGEGAYLLNAAGERFMVARHEMAELAPRDVVSRNIVRVMEEEGSENVFLDCRHLGADFVHRRFPTIWDRLEERGIDMAHDLIPVAPAQHFHSGGILTELNGRSTLRGLYAVGESACSGVHGANRLASNSLLEGLVFATRAAKDAADLVADGTLIQGDPVERSGPASLVPATMRPKIQQVAHKGAGPFRTAQGLATAVSKLSDIRSRFHTTDAPVVMPQVAEWETSNTLSCAAIIAEAALAREESRGGHQRTDFPDADDANFRVRLASALDPDGNLELIRVPLELS
jgi:L-aspartate oxidase